MTKSTAQLVDTCPDCGFAFPKPQVRCRSAVACKRRQDARTAQPAVDAALDTEPADAAAPLKVKLTSATQEALVDEFLPGDGRLRSGRAGHWLVIHQDEAVAVSAALSRLLDDEGRLNGVQANAARTLSTKIADAAA